MYFFFFNDTATTEIYPLSLHDALPISLDTDAWGNLYAAAPQRGVVRKLSADLAPLADLAEGLVRSEEHTSELQSQSNLVCRLLLEKKKKEKKQIEKPNLQQKISSRSTH